MNPIGQVSSAQTGQTHRAPALSTVDCRLSTDKLLAVLRARVAGGVLVAFSGGVDSAVVLAALARLQREQPFTLLAVTVATPFHLVREGAEAAEVARQLGVPHRLLHIDTLQNAAVVANPPDRCYHCKRALFGQLLALAEAEGLATVMEGTHAGDSTGWRPGRKALTELGIVSPLAEAGLTKPEIRALAAAWALGVAQKPSAPCLATRFPYGTAMTAEGLERVGLCEALLRRLLPGVRELRLRDHLPIARLEVPPEAFQTVLAHREELLRLGQASGYEFVTLDLAGFRSGSFDKGLV